MPFLLIGQADFIFLIEPTFGLEAHGEPAAKCRRVVPRDIGYGIIRGAGGPIGVRCFVLQSLPPLHPVALAVETVLLGQERFELGESNGIGGHFEALHPEAPVALQLDFARRDVAPENVRRLVLMHTDAGAWVAEVRQAASDLGAPFV